MKSRALTSSLLTSRCFRNSDVHPYRTPTVSSEGQERPRPTSPSGCGYFERRLAPSETNQSPKTCKIQQYACSIPVDPTRPPQALHARQALRDRITTKRGPSPTSSMALCPRATCYHGSRATGRVLSLESLQLDTQGYHSRTLYSTGSDRRRFTT